MYISRSESNIGNMLSQEDDNGIKIAIYYTILVLNDAETRYNAIENCVYVYIYPVQNWRII